MKQVDDVRNGWACGVGTFTHSWGEQSGQQQPVRSQGCTPGAWQGHFQPFILQRRLALAHSTTYVQGCCSYSSTWRRSDTTKYLPAGKGRSNWNYVFSSHVKEVRSLQVLIWRGLQCMQKTNKQTTKNKQYPEHRLTRPERRGTSLSCLSPALVPGQG